MATFEITYRHLDPSPALTDYAKKKSEALTKNHDKIIACRVIVGTETQQPHRHGTPYAVRIELTVPGDHIVEQESTHEDPNAAVNHAFDAVKRTLVEHNRKRRDAHRQPKHD